MPPEMPPEYEVHIWHVPMATWKVYAPQDNVPYCTTDKASAATIADRLGTVKSPAIVVEYPPSDRTPRLGITVYQTHPQPPSRFDEGSANG